MRARFKISKIYNYRMNNMRTDLIHRYLVASFWIMLFLFVNCLDGCGKPKNQSEDQTPPSQPVNPGPATLASVAGTWNIANTGQSGTYSWPSGKVEPGSDGNPITLIVNGNGSAELKCSSGFTFNLTLSPGATGGEWIASYPINTTNEKLDLIVSLNNFGSGAGTIVVTSSNYHMSFNLSNNTNG